MKKNRLLIQILMLLASCTLYAQKSSVEKTLRVDFTDMVWHFSGAGKDIKVSVPMHLGPDVKIKSAFMYVAQMEVREVTKTMKIGLEGKKGLDFSAKPWNSLKRETMQQSPNLATILDESIKGNEGWKQGDFVDFTLSGFETKPITSALSDTENHSYLEVTYTYEDEESVIGDDLLTSSVLYPNPTFDSFKIKLHNGETISSWVVFGISGKKYMSGYDVNASDEIVINTQTLSSGNYIIQLKDAQGSSHAMKFIKK